MAVDKSLPVFVGWDSREAVCSDVAAHSIRRRTQKPLSIRYLKHRELRQEGQFARPWLIDGSTGNYTDLIDGRPFSTEFSHTRFLVPALMGYRNEWALFMDADMIFLSDINKLFALCDDRYAAMVVKHIHIPVNTEKMDGRQQLKYGRKNWSSFVLWNCGHEANKQLTAEKVSFMRGYDLHSFSWLPDHLIGALPYSYNYISGVSPKFSQESGGRPDVIHFTDGGPWFDSCKDVPYAGTWIEEYEHWQEMSGGICSIPSMAYEAEEKVRK